ncbi:hypothetical protein RvY_04551 [Ramazzottius varieornatus]|uniref:Uncharacterized protein n=1 Tax=Ramazzottius varieornatus TaxID=947166 RepID=A0A1D1UVJ3_RAMVA|nr:hypothetical protein RvY_04551 [Ramazzottius varieornatus]
MALLMFTAHSSGDSEMKYERSLPAARLMGYAGCLSVVCGSLSAEGTTSVPEGGVTVSADGEERWKSLLNAVTKTVIKSCEE